MGLPSGLRESLCGEAQLGVGFYWRLRLGRANGAGTDKPAPRSLRLLHRRPDLAGLGHEIGAGRASRVLFLS